jgi:hypothetical protein
MKLQTLLALVGANIEPPLVSLPKEPSKQLSIGTLKADGNLDLIATLNLKGRELTAERHSTVLRLFQLLGEAVAGHDRPALQILSRQDAPLCISVQSC